MTSCSIALTRMATASFPQTSSKLCVLWPRRFLTAAASQLLGNDASDALGEMDKNVDGGVDKEEWSGR